MDFFLTFILSVLLGGLAGLLFVYVVGLDKIMTDPHYTLKFYAATLVGFIFAVLGVLIVSGAIMNLGAFILSLPMAVGFCVSNAKEEVYESNHPPPPEKTPEEIAEERLKDLLDKNRGPSK